MYFGIIDRALVVLALFVPVQLLCDRSRVLRGLPSRLGIDMQIVRGFALGLAGIFLIYRSSGLGGLTPPDFYLGLIAMAAFFGEARCWLLCTGMIIGYAGYRGGLNPELGVSFVNSVAVSAMTTVILSRLWRQKKESTEGHLTFSALGFFCHLQSVLWLCWIHRGSGELSFTSFPFGLQLFVTGVWMAWLPFLAELENRQIRRIERVRGLTQKETALERLQDAARIGYWELDFVSRKFRPAATFLRMLGLPPGSRMCQTIDDLGEYVHPRDRVATFQWLSELGGSPTRTVHRWIRMDAEIRYFWSIAWPEFDERGRLIKFCGLSQDITEEKVLEELLPHVTKLASIGEMAAVISHELRAPLSLLVNYIELASKTQELPGLLGKMTKACEKMGRVVNGLQTYSRPSKDPGLLLDVNETISGTAGIFRELFPKLRIEFQVDLCDDLPAMIGSGDKLQSILMNLLVNAKDAVLPVSEPRIRIRSFAGDRIEIHVSDNGPGLTPDVQSRIFEPFFTTKSKNSGMGLGLSICRGIAAEMSGEIRVESSPGAGSTFILSFPAVHCAGIGTVLGSLREEAGFQTA